MKIAQNFTVISLTVILHCGKIWTPKTFCSSCY